MTKNVNENATEQLAAKAVGSDLLELAEALLGDVEDVLASLPDGALNDAPAGLGNSPYVLIYHLLGSARYWIGEVVGGQPTGRVRAEEFGAEGTKADLEARLQDTRARLTSALNGFSGADLRPHPVDLSRGVLSWGSLPPAGRTSVWVVAHDLAHTAYHLGQLRLMQRLLDAPAQAPAR